MANTFTGRVETIDMKYARQGYKTRAAARRRMRDLDKQGIGGMDVVLCRRRCLVRSMGAT